nr:hypothetical protein [Desulforamulus aquiferis]
MLGAKRQKGLMKSMNKKIRIIKKIIVQFLKFPDEDFVKSPSNDKDADEAFRFAVRVVTGIVCSIICGKLINTFCQIQSTLLLQMLFFGTYILSDGL